MSAPTTKKDFYRRWLAMEFGNRVRMWSNQADLLVSYFAGTVTARAKEAAGRCYYRVPVKEAATSPAYAGMTFNESAPDDYLTIQGELMHDTLQGYALFSSTEQLPMRKALASSGVQYYGLQALGRIKYFCNAKSYAMMMELLDLYPEAVVEFGCYSRCLGEIPGHNTVIWEVRNY